MLIGACNPMLCPNWGFRTTGVRPAIPAVPEACGAYLELMAACWATDPAERPLFREAVAKLQRS